MFLHGVGVAQWPHLLSNLAKMPDSAILTPAGLEGKSKADDEGHLLNGIAFKDTRRADVEGVAHHILTVQLKQIGLGFESVGPASNHENELPLFHSASLHT